MAQAEFVLLRHACQTSRAALPTLHTMTGWHHTCAPAMLLAVEAAADINAKDGNQMQGDHSQFKSNQFKV